MLPVGQIICGDCLEVMKDWPDNSVDTVICDPPYALGFMGKSWDTFDKSQFGRAGNEGEQDLKVKKNFKILPRYSNWSGYYDFSFLWATEALRIAKPGAMMLVFGGTRTYHRLTCAIEDAGWQIRDCMMWLYGSGFPKSHDISKAIDKAKGVERKQAQIDKKDMYGKYQEGSTHRAGMGSGKSFGMLQTEADKANYTQTMLDTAPVTDLAKCWDGWGTALKPAWEPIIVAMKPLDGTFVQNAEKWGVAGLNIDGGRVGTEDNLDGGAYSKGKQSDGQWGTMHNYTGKDYEPRSLACECNP